MIRRLAFIVLAACSDAPTDDEPPCFTELGSDTLQLQGLVRSGANFVGVTWATRHGTSQPIIHGAMLMPDGTLGPDIRLPETLVGGTTGATTILWHPLLDDSPTGDNFFATLQRGAEAIHFPELQLPTRSHAIVFDGTSYQVFWFDVGGNVYHRSISETGVLGPAHVLSTGLASESSSISAASNGAGQTFVRIFDDGFLVDTHAGTLGQRLFDGNEAIQYSEAVYFAGNYHVVEAGATTQRLVTLAPTPQYRTLPPVNVHAGELYATASSLYVHEFNQILELDTSLAVVQRTDLGAITKGGILGDDIVLLDRRDHDPETLAPGGLFALRRSGGTELWRVDLAVDSFVHEREVCIPEIPDPEMMP